MTLRCLWVEVWKDGLVGGVVEVIWGVLANSELCLETLLVSSKDSHRLWGDPVMWCASLWVEGGEDIWVDHRIWGIWGMRLGTLPERRKVFASHNLFNYEYSSHYLK